MSNSAARYAPKSATPQRPASVRTEASWKYSSGWPPKPVPASASQSRLPPARGVVQTRKLSRGDQSDLAAVTRRGAPAEYGEAAGRRSTRRRARAAQSGSAPCRSGGPSPAPPCPAAGAARGSGRARAGAPPPRPPRRRETRSFRHDQLRQGTPRLRHHRQARRQHLENGERGELHIRLREVQADVGARQEGRDLARRQRADEAHTVYKTARGNVRLELPAAAAEAGDQHADALRGREKVEQPPRELYRLQPRHHRDSDRTRTSRLRQLEAAAIHAVRDPEDPLRRQVRLQLLLEIRVHRVAVVAVRQADAGVSDADPALGRYAKRRGKVLALCPVVEHDGRSNLLEDDAKRRLRRHRHDVDARRFHLFSQALPGACARVEAEDELRATWRVRTPSTSIRLPPPASVWTRLTTGSLSRRSRRRDERRYRFGTRRCELEQTGLIAAEPLSCGGVRSGSLARRPGPGMGQCQVQKRDELVGAYVEGGLEGMRAPPDRRQTRAAGQ